MANLNIYFLFIMNINIVITISLLFFLSEFVLLLTKRSKRKNTFKRKDKHSLTLLWIIITISITCGFLFANYNDWSTSDLYLAFVGFAFMSGGICLRWLSIIRLSREFTVDVAVSKTHRLQTSGIYKKIRHPSYLGLLFMFLGLSVSMNSFTSVLTVTLPILLAILYRIYIEEGFLEEMFGEEYMVYKKNSYRLLPGIY